jgi:hypothetical protein
MLLVQTDDDVLPRQHPLGQAFAFLLRERTDWLKKNATVPTTDAWLARLGLLAGDAELTKALHGIHDPPESLHGLAAAETTDFLRDLDAAIFGAGKNFAKALYHLGEWDQVNAAYERPPVTTAELVDAGLYFSEHQFEPRRVNWPGLKVAGQEPFWDDALGQLGTRVYLLHQMPPDKTDAVFGRWEGDRWLAYDAGAQKRGHVAWQTLWHDSWAADHFFAAMQQRVQAGSPDAPVGVEDKGLWRWTGGGRTVILARTEGGRGVFYADAATPEFAEALRATFLKP